MRIFCLLPILISMLGCATTAVPQAFDPEQFSSLLERRQFTEAKALLYGQPGMALTTEQSQQYHQQLDTSSALYVHDLLQGADAWQQQNQWYQAEQAYREGLDALPGSTQLQDGYDQFSQQQQFYVDDLKHQLKLHRARLLPREIELTEHLCAVDPGNEKLQNTLDNMQREAESLILFLTPLAQQAFSKGLYKQTMDFDRQILALGDSEPSRARLAKIEESLSQDARRRARNRQQAQNRKREALWQSYDEALSISDFITAQSALGELDALGFKGPVAQEQREHLQTMIQEKSAALIAEGKKYYTRGKLDSALIRWREALLLLPENQDLIARIKRAEVFQANYQRLAR